MIAVATEQQPSDVAAWDAYTPQQLHGDACITCGATGDLIRAGHVRTESTVPGSPLTWAVNACPAHATEQPS